MELTQELINQIANAILPIGSVVAYAGQEANLPRGWVPCDGRNYPGMSIPDLRNRFIMGSEKEGSVFANGRTGGRAKSNSDFDHTFELKRPGNGNWPTDPGFFGVYAQYNVREFNIENRPPYYTLMYIIKVA